jgi:Carbohydrate-selective porin, OprB family
LAQLTFKPSDRLKVAFTYINAYNQELATGSNRANVGSFLGGVVQGLTGSDEEITIPTSSNSYGVQASFAISEKFVLGGWVGYTNARSLSTADGLIDTGDVDIWNYAVTLGFPDLGKPPIT